MERATIHIPNGAECSGSIEQPASTDERSVGVGRLAKVLKQKREIQSVPGCGSADSIDSASSTEPDEQSIIDGIAALQQQLMQLQERKTEEIEQIYEALADIGLKVAEKFLVRAADDNRLAVEQLVREVVELCGEPTQLVVRVNPDDEALLAARLTGEELFTIESDSQLNRGECVADTGQFVASLRWANRLAEIREEIVEGLNDSLS